MVTTYKPKKPPKVKPASGGILVILKKDDPISKQIKDAADAIKKWCPDIFRKSDPFPTLRLIKLKEDEITYELTTGKGSRAKVGCI